MLGLVLGAAAGIASKAYVADAPPLLWIVENVATPVGQVFLRMLFLIFFSLTFGVALTARASRSFRAWIVLSTWPGRFPTCWATS